MIIKVTEFQIHGKSLSSAVLIIVQLTIDSHASAFISQISVTCPGSPWISVEVVRLTRRYCIRI